MIFGIGIDIIEIARIRKSLKKFDDRFEQKIFTSHEISYCRGKADPAKHFAARFAVKEAVLKALGTGMAEGIGWRDLEVWNDLNSGQPALNVYGKGEEIFNALKLKAIHISISHDQFYAIAQAIAEK